MKNIKDDKEYWVKAFMNNKITIKNTWNSNLIEQFNEINTFCTDEGVNFQRASIVLDGCVKVYSLRVDDVSDNAERLAKIFEPDEEKEKIKRIKQMEGNFIAKNVSLINMPLDSIECFFDPVFQSIFSSTDISCLIEKLNISPEGIFLYESPQSAINFNYFIESDFEYHKSPILTNIEFSNNHTNSSNINGIELSNNPAETAEEIKMQPIDNEECFLEDNNTILQDKTDPLEFSMFKPEDTVMNASETFHFDIIENSADFKDQNVTAVDISFIEEPSPFEYFPRNSNLNRLASIQKNKRNKIAIRRIAKKNEFIDFSENKDTSVLFKVSKSIMTKNEFKRYKNNKNILPYDFSFRVKNLYSLLLNSNKYFSYTNPEDEQSNRSFNFDETIGIQEAFSNSGNEKISVNSIVYHNDVHISDNIEDYSESGKISQFINNKREETINTGKVDMKRLKADILVEIKNNNASGYREIFSHINEMYKSTLDNVEEGEGKEQRNSNLSPHLYFIGLLHIANENNFELYNNNEGDIHIKRTNV